LLHLCLLLLLLEPAGLQAVELLWWLLCWLQCLLPDLLMYLQVPWLLYLLQHLPLLPLFWLLMCLLHQVRLLQHLLLLLLCQAVAPRPAAAA
jgi:hypothetical protein